MIILLFGKDTYRSLQKLNEIIERYKKIHQSGLNLKYFDLRGDYNRPAASSSNITSGRPGLQDFKNEIQSVSMFNEKKLLVLNNVFSNRTFKEDFLKNSKRFINSGDIILFYEQGEISATEKLLQFFKKHGKSQEFKPLEGQKLKNWIKKEFRKYGAGVDSETEEKLINLIGNDLWRFSNEIKKLATFKKGKKIETKDIELLVRPKIEVDIFKTVDAIALKNKRQALFLIHKHLEKGDSPLYLLSMINFQFRNLLIIKDLIEKNKTYNTILSISKLHPFIVKKSYFQAKRFTIQELKKIYQRIFKVDLDIKTGRLDPQTALDLLITEI